MRSRIVSLTMIGFLCIYPQSPSVPISSNGEQDYVILLHGLGRTARSMKKMEKCLITEGYRVFNIDYPSRKYSIEKLAAEQLGPMIEERLADTETQIHFVTHSLGGIILRCYLKEHTLKNLGRVIMLSPPNRGSELADRLKDNIFFKAFTGPSGQELGAGSDSVPNSLGGVNFELGVIAGNRSWNPFFSTMIPGVDDGIVSIESAKIEGMKDFLVLNHSHAFIMSSAEVIEQVCYFLEHGRFRRVP
jgi:triacylglycerol lipase